MKMAHVMCGVILLAAVAGCAKQPTATTGVTSPSPAGGAGGGAGAGGRMDASTPGGSGGSGSRSGTASGGNRPPLKDFAEAPDLKDVHFDYDKADIREADSRILDANAEWLKARTDRLVVIEGHCDERGTTEYNTALGDRRAKATMNYLVSRGVPASRITVISYGEERPSCSQHTEECWSTNRRAHFLVNAR